jgi:hypothetical protein
VTSWIDPTLVEVSDHLRQVGYAFPIRLVIVSAEGWLIGRYDAPRPRVSSADRLDPQAKEDGASHPHNVQRSPRSATRIPDHRRGWRIH